MVEELSRWGGKVGAVVTPDPYACLGVNSRVELAQAQAIMSHRIRQAWMLAGVTLEDPESTQIDTLVTLESGHEGSAIHLPTRPHLCGPRKRDRAGFHIDRYSGGSGLPSSLFFLRRGRSGGGSARGALLLFTGSGECSDVTQRPIKT